MWAFWLFHNCILTISNWRYSREEKESSVFAPLRDNMAFCGWEMCSDPGSSSPALCAAPFLLFQRNPAEICSQLSALPVVVALRG